MPKEKFYEYEREHPKVEGDGSEPDLTVQWGDEPPYIQGAMALNSRSAINRLIRSLRRARNQQFGKDQ
ncbi:hypothetical protein BPY_06970 [Bifidobacterium psychraerophilum]|uniref:hypothetical protein n=1 Tax=Bifidobacterium psychraerophilum TaxID=218140 RepID=UPI003118CA0C